MRGARERELAEYFPEEYPGISGYAPHVAPSVYRSRREAEAARARIASRKLLAEAGKK